MNTKIIILSIICSLLLNIEEINAQSTKVWDSISTQAFSNTTNADSYTYIGNANTAILSDIATYNIDLNWGLGNGDTPDVANGEYGTSQFDPIGEGFLLIILFLTIYTSYKVLKKKKVLTQRYD